MSFVDPSASPACSAVARGTLALGLVAMVVGLVVGALLGATGGWVLASHVYLRARRLLALAERHEARTRLVLIRAVELLPRRRKAAAPRTPDAGR